MKNLYIAFSIHGTNKFIVATRTVNDVEYQALITLGFSVTTSRRPRYNQEKDGIKMHWNKLTTLKGDPYRSAPMILSRFKDLENAGWTITGRDEFIKKHWNNAA
ncbi:hypothetical protein [Ralstonia phage RP13]|nr:hypothetical protein [Ralstonia phage RP13]